MSANAAHRRPVPARVVHTQELRRSGAAGLHARDTRRAQSRNACRGAGLRRALREQAW